MTPLSRLGAQPCLQNGMKSQNRTTVSHEYISLSDEDTLLVKQSDYVNLKK